MIILNNAKSVQVLKAVNLPTLRLMPGHNTVDGRTINKYFKDNQAAEAIRKEFLVKVADDEVTPEEKLKADEAKAKNDELNRAQRIIKNNAVTMANDKSTIQAQAKQIEEQAKQLNALSERLDEVMASVAEEKAE